MTQKFLPYGQQNITEADLEAVTAVLKGAFLTTGPKVAEFEEAFADYVGAAHGIAVANGTAALHLACLALDLQPGDVVLTPAMSFAASTNGALYGGAKIEFMDCDPATGLITPELFAAAADRAAAKGKPAKIAVIVHLNGEHADMAGIAREASSRDIQLIEDSCHALGTTFADENGDICKVGACRYSTFSTFSTHPVKTITTGEGGVITTNDVQLAERLRLLRSHGIERNPDHFERTDLAFDVNGNPNPWYYEVQSLGFNYRLTDISCALGLSQLARMDEIAKRRRELAREYDKLFEKAGLPLDVIPAQEKVDAVRHLYPVLVDFEAFGMEKSRFANDLRSKGIGTQVHYVPTHLHPLYIEKFGAVKMPGAEEYYRRVISLPLYPELTSEDLKRVVGAIGEVIAPNR